MTEQTIEQILTKLASVDEAGVLELRLDSSIYPPDVIAQATVSLQENPVASLEANDSGLVRIVAKNPQAGRLAIGLASALLLQFAATHASRQ